MTEWPRTVTIEAFVSPLVVSTASMGSPLKHLRADDREAVEACQRGEREAFDRLVERYQRDIYRLCYRYVNNHEDANDMAQEVFLKAYRAIGRFRGDSSFSTWLYRIAVNTCLNFRASAAPAGAGAAGGAARSGDRRRRAPGERRGLRARPGGGEPPAREAAGDRDPQDLPRAHPRGGRGHPRLDRGDGEGEPVPCPRQAAKADGGGAEREDATPVGGDAAGSDGVRPGRRRARAPRGVR